MTSRHYPNEFHYPATQEERRAGMAAFRAKLLAAKQTALADPTCKMTKRMRAFVEADCAAIRAAQVRLGEVEA